MTTEKTDAAKNKRTEVDELKRRVETCHTTIREQRETIDRLHACADGLLGDLRRIDETSLLPDGDGVCVSVAVWAGEWVKRMTEAGYVTANDGAGERGTHTQNWHQASIAPTRVFTGGHPPKEVRMCDNASAGVRTVQDLVRDFEDMADRRIRLCVANKVPAQKDKYRGQAEAFFMAANMLKDFIANVPVRRAASASPPVAGSHPLMDCPRCGKFREHGHDCDPEPVCADCGSDLDQNGHCKRDCANAKIS